MAYLPSDIGRLVYGYLQSECSEEVANEFLYEYKPLEECLKLKQSGHRFCTKFQNLHIPEILTRFLKILDLCENINTSETNPHKFPSLIGNFVERNLSVVADCDNNIQNHLVTNTNPEHQSDFSLSSSNIDGYQCFKPETLVKNGQILVNDNLNPNRIDLFDREVENSSSIPESLKKPSERRLRVSYNDDVILNTPERPQLTSVLASAQVITTPTANNSPKTPTVNNSPKTPTVNNSPKTPTVNNSPNVTSVVSPALLRAVEEATNNMKADELRMKAVSKTSINFDVQNRSSRQSQMDEFQTVSPQRSMIYKSGTALNNSLIAPSKIATSDKNFVMDDVETFMGKSVCSNVEYPMLFKNRSKITTANKRTTHLEISSSPPGDSKFRHTSCTENWKAQSADDDLPSSSGKISSAIIELPQSAEPASPAKRSQCENDGKIAIVADKSPAQPSFSTISPTKNVLMKGSRSITGVDKITTSPLHLLPEKLASKAMPWDYSLRQSIADDIASSITTKTDKKKSDRKYRTPTKRKWSPPRKQEKCDDNEPPHGRKVEERKNERNLSSSYENKNEIEDATKLDLNPGPLKRKPLGKGVEEAVIVCKKQKKLEAKKAATSKNLIKLETEKKSSAKSIEDMSKKEEKLVARVSEREKSPSKLAKSIHKIYQGNIEGESISLSHGFEVIAKENNVATGDANNSDSESIMDVKLDISDVIVIFDRPPIITIKTA